MMQNNIKSKLLREVEYFYEKEGDAFSRTRRHSWPLMNLFKKYLKKNDVLLDIGAGNGRLIEGLPKDIEYIGVEPSLALRDSAKRLYSVYDNFKIINGRLPRLDLDDNLADVLSCIAVLHHVPSRDLRKMSVDEMYRILKPGGVAIISVWNLRSEKFFNWKSFWHAWLRLPGIKYASWGDYYVPWKSSGRVENRYVHAFTLREFKSLFKDKKWDIINIGSYDKGGWVSFWQGRNLVAVLRKK